MILFSQLENLEPTFKTRTKMNKNINRKTSEAILL